MKKKVSSYLLPFTISFIVIGMASHSPLPAQKKITVNPTNCQKSSANFRDKVKSKCSQKKDPKMCMEKNKPRLNGFMGKCQDCNKKLKARANSVKKKCAKIKDKNEKSKCLNDGKQRLEAKHKECLKTAMGKKK